MHSLLVLLTRSVLNRGVKMILCATQMHSPKNHTLPSNCMRPNETAQCRVCTEAFKAY